MEPFGKEDLERDFPKESFLEKLEIINGKPIISYMRVFDLSQKSLGEIGFGGEALRVLSTVLYGCDFGRKYLLEKGYKEVKRGYILK